MLQESLIFTLGGGAYVMVELLWRGYSHISMFLLGGLCFWLIGRLDREKSIPVIRQAVLGACLVTGLELLTGLIVNCWLNLGVWDYSSQPLNFLGQICLPYSLLWIPVSLAAIWLYDRLDGVVLRLTFPQDIVK